MHKEREKQWKHENKISKNMQAAEYFHSIKQFSCQESRWVINIVTKAARSFNATSLYTGNFRITSHRPIISKSIKEPKKKKKDPDAWDPFHT